MENSRIINIPLGFARILLIEIQSTPFPCSDSKRGLGMEHCQGISLLLVKEMLQQFIQQRDATILLTVLCVTDTVSDAASVQTQFALIKLSSKLSLSQDICLHFPTGTRAPLNNSVNESCSEGV